MKKQEFKSGGEELLAIVMELGEKGETVNKAFQKLRKNPDAGFGPFLKEFAAYKDSMQITTELIVKLASEYIMMSDVFLTERALLTSIIKTASEQGVVLGEDLEARVTLHKILYGGPNEQ